MAITPTSTKKHKDKVPHPSNGDDTSVPEIGDADGTKPGAKTERSPELTSGVGPLLLDAMLAFRNGDFTVRLPAHWTGVYGKIADVFNETIRIAERLDAETARGVKIVERIEEAAAALPIEEALEEDDARVLRPAALALGHAQHAAALPALIALLSHESRGVRTASEWALAQITGLRFRADAARWRAWLRAEEAWFEGRSPRLRAALALVEARVPVHADDVPDRPHRPLPVLGRRRVVRERPHRTLRPTRQPRHVLHRLRGQHRHSLPTSPQNVLATSFRRDAVCWD